MVIEQVASIIFNRQVAVDVRLMGLRSPLIAEKARPGQFAMIRVSHGMDPLLRRPFSICGVRDDMILILYRVAGRGTRIMSETGHGNSLAVLGPLGKGFSSTSAGHRFPILIAGGMGIAPLLFLARSTASAPYAFLAGFGSVDRIIGVDQVGLTDIEISLATDDGSAGHHGPVTELLNQRLTALNGNPGIVFGCGPLPMLKAVAAITRERDIPCQVSLETAMACGLGACQGCAVKAAPGQDRVYRHVCQDGPVFDATDVDWGAL